MTITIAIAFLAGLLADNPGATPGRAWGWLSGVIVGVGLVVMWMVGK